MKAAVLHEIGGVPRDEDFPDPVAGDDEAVIDVKAVAVENVDKAFAAGTHYASRQYIALLPAIAAFDGIGAVGVPPHIVREIAGHSALDVTMTIYAHTSLEERYRALIKLDERIGKESLSSDWRQSSGGTDTK